eukprot:COSAG01_NODE_64532_length_276_cov_0.587571_1_plen_84_part_01
MERNRRVEERQQRQRQVQKMAMPLHRGGGFDAETMSTVCAGPRSGVIDNLELAGKRSRALGEQELEPSISAVPPAPQPQPPPQP